jgi:hypothetical protein
MGSFTPGNPFAPVLDPSVLTGKDIPVYAQLLILRIIVAGEKLSTLLYTIVN